MFARFSNDNMTVETEENNPPSYSVLEMILSPMVRFWITLIFEIPSLACTLLLLYYFCFDRTLRQASNNHVFIAVLTIGFFSLIIDIPNTLTQLRLGYVWPQTPANCYAWWLMGTANYNLVGMLMAWAAFERHILVFHSRWHSTRKKRIHTHYAPLAIIITYAYLFYTFCLALIRCDIFDYTQFWCGVPCFFAERMLLLFEALSFGILPCLLISVFNILLFVRVIKQKQRLRQQIQWKKYRRMIIQLVSCSALYLLLNVPIVSLAVARLFGLPFGATGQFEVFVVFSSAFSPIFMPFVCLGSSPEIWSKIKQTLTTPPAVTITAATPAIPRAATHTAPAAALPRIE